MDWLKNCKTNVHTIDDLLKTHFNTYNFSKSGEYISIGAVVAELRGLGVLCTVEAHELWAFNALTPEAKQLVESEAYELKADDEGTLETHPSKRSVNGRAAKDLLYEAIEAALSFTLTRQYGVFRVGRWSWLFQDSHKPASQESSDILVQLHVTFSEAGTMYIATTTHHIQLRTICTDEPINDQVLLAPTGTKAELVWDAASVVNANDDRKARSVSSLLNDVWKAGVISYVRGQGVELTPDVDWLTVRLVGAPVAQIFAWPAVLCLAAMPVGRPEVVEASNWGQWFTGMNETSEFRDRIALAEDWFTKAAEREMLAASLSVLPGTEVVADGAFGVSTTSPAISTLVTSPPFLQRVADQQAALLGIYPTPPDGLIHINASQHAVLESVTAPPTVDTAGDLLHSTDETHPSLRLLESSSVPPLIRTDQDDLFGDMSFATDGIDEVDFSFFDEPDDVPSSAPHLEDGSDAVMPALGHQAEHDSVAADVEDEVMEDEICALVTTNGKGQDVLEEHSTSTVTSPGAGTRYEAAEIHSSDSANKPTQPLSPLTIKERLLPPPVPASIAKQQGGQSIEHPSRSIFAPIAFREGLDLGTRYTEQYPIVDAALLLDTATTNTSLPPQRKKPRFQRQKTPFQDRNASEGEIESEEDSYETGSSRSDEDLPPKLPWENKKRKRPVRLGLLSNSFERMWSDDNGGSVDRVHHTEEQTRALMDELTKSKPSTASDNARNCGANDGIRRSTGEASSLTVDEMFDELSKLDLVYIAQIVCEQATTCTMSLVRALNDVPAASELIEPANSALQALMDRTLDGFVPSAKACETQSLSLIREPTSRAISAPTTARPGQPRLPQRLDSTIPAPEIFGIPPPFIRVQRGADTYEMLPTALDFWETLSLTPASGAKDVRAVCIFPSNDDLQKLVVGLLRELGSAYENSKLGSHKHVRTVLEDSDLDEYEDGLAPVELGSDADESIEAALRAYSTVCIELGLFLASIGHLEPLRTTVIYIINPFSHPGATQCLCACFWQLYKAYRDNAPKTRRSDARSDITLQIIPIDLLTSTDTMVILTAKQQSLLAKEVYDRCPPPTSPDVDHSSAVSVSTAPFVELASAPPKRIGFQLAADPPSDLLHEGSILHMAYATSSDEQWLTVSWVEATGCYSSSTAFCLCGKSFADIAEDVWVRTREIMAARDVTWRVFIIAAGNISPSIRQCWRDIVVAQSRKQPFSITLLLADLDPILQLSPPISSSDEVEGKAALLGAGFLTPATTPQGTTITVSPDPSGPSNAPLTPAPSDSAATALDNDIEAHLIDLADESWGMLYASVFFSEAELAKGALFKRGGSRTEGPLQARQRLPSLAMSLLWTVQVRPSGTVDEGNVKQAEMTLREVIKMYRNLDVLTKARGLRVLGGGESVIPIHLLAALNGAHAIDGFLS